MNRTDRLLAIVLELQAKGWQRAEDLAATFEISKRTIYRDMMALMEAGVPVIATPGQGFSLVEGYFLPPLSLSVEEAIVLLLGADTMQQTFDAQYQRAANSAATKIQAVLSERARKTIDDLRERMQFIAVNAGLASPATAQPAILSTLRRAIIDQRRVHLQYQARSAEDSEPTERDVDPYKLVYVERAWYLVAYCHLRQAQRNFRLDRIDAVAVLDKTFTRPVEPIQANIAVATLPLLVRVHVQSEMARWVVEAGSYYLISTHPATDGIELRLRVRREADLIPWLLGWGAAVTVLEPESLRHRLAETARKMLDHHQTSPPATLASPTHEI